MANAGVLIVFHEPYVWYLLFDFTWQGLGSRTAAGVASMSRAQQLPHVRSELVPADPTETCCWWELSHEQCWKFSAAQESPKEVQVCPPAVHSHHAELICVSRHWRIPQCSGGWGLKKATGAYSIILFRREGNTFFKNALSLLGRTANCSMFTLRYQLDLLLWLQMK